MTKRTGFAGGGAKFDNKNALEKVSAAINNTALRYPMPEFKMCFGQQPV
jgi:hypothetical protein